jgi:thymidylate synthase
MRGVYQNGAIRVTISPMKNIPVLHVSGRSLAEAYERALVALHEGGIRVKTQYDRQGDPESVDATMNITVEEPWADPMIHKAFPGGVADLREYVMELAGAKDHWVKNMDDPADTRWEYTYHQRLADWGTWRQRAPRHEGAPGTGVNQVTRVVEKLARQPFTRQAQMITWMPAADLDAYDPPCLQSLWYRLLDHEGEWWLNCNVRFRSNDAWGASFMNMFGFTHFNRSLIADPLQQRLGRPVHLGRLNWQADSYHLYGKDQADFTSRFLRRREAGAFSERVMSFFTDDIQEMWREAEAEAAEKISRYDKSRAPG